MIKLMTPDGTNDIQAFEVQRRLQSICTFNLLTDPFQAAELHVLFGFCRAINLALYLLKVYPRRLQQMLALPDGQIQLPFPSRPDPAP